MRYRVPASPAYGQIEQQGLPLMQQPSFLCASRIGRLRLLLYLMLTVLVGHAAILLILAGHGLLTGGSAPTASVWNVVLMCYAAQLGYAVVLVMRRLHDLNLSAWWLLLLLIPVFNLTLLAALLAMSGNSYDNRYGHMPAPNGKLTLAVVPVVLVAVTGFSALILSETVRSEAEAPTQVHAGR